MPCLNPATMPSRSSSGGGGLQGRPSSRAGSSRFLSSGPIDIIHEDEGEEAEATRPRGVQGSLAQPGGASHTAPRQAAVVNRGGGGHGLDPLSVPRQGGLAGLRDSDVEPRSAGELRLMRRTSNL